MTVLALAIGRAELAAAPVAAGVGPADIRRIALPAEAKWDACRDLLLEVAGDDEITAVGIACPGGIPSVSGEFSLRHTGFGIVAAVRRMFPVAIVQVATRELCRALAERNLGPVPGADAILAGAGVLALIAEERVPRTSHRDTRGPTRRPRRATCLRPRRR
ncbi:hypothetical protein [Nocardia blacklockiae]|uniref:hypothetical protein n=1 Tax=Nocardia blacklockiae TaxID=480036 RepID=UPI001894C2CC|nr:hypothetical protein [Nocardia blacklockiae]MBF6172112.1 hypothetical protein [Nocardia blacklockiae]